VVRGRPKVDLEIYRDELQSLYEHGVSIQHISEIFAERDIKIPVRTIKRRFKEWHIRKRLPPIDVSDDLKRRIQVLFFEVGLEDDDMLHVLQQEGFQIGRQTLVRTRYQMNLRRRARTVEQQQDADRLIRQLVAQELATGKIDGYGRTFLYTYFRQQGCPFARDRLFQIYRTMNPVAVENRKHDLQRQRGAFITPGPNHVWSIDGYDKLKPYGVEIYACIDAYSRYILWIYVGISNSTAISCLRQYLDCIEIEERQPRFVRSDRGTETVMLADTHYRLLLENEPDLEFKDCYMYGTSTANVRIESWWGQMTKGQLFKWRVRTKDLFLKSPINYI
jgi:hypothetical protein